MGDKARDCMAHEPQRCNRDLNERIASGRSEDDPIRSPGSDVMPTERMARRLVFANKVSRIAKVPSLPSENVCSGRGYFADAVLVIRRDAVE